MEKPWMKEHTINWYGLKREISDILDDIGIKELHVQLEAETMRRILVG